MPTDSNHTPFATLLPASGWVMDPARFERETERNDGWSNPPTLAVWPGFSSPMSDYLPAAGVIGRIRYMFDGQIVTVKGTGAVTPTDQWPHGLLGRFQLRLNGQSTPWNLKGVDLNVLRAARYKSIADTGGLSVVTVGTDGTYPVRIFWDIPLAIDPSISPSGGGLFAQSVNSQITCELTTAASAEIFTLTGTAAYTPSGVFRRFLNWYAIPTGPIGQRGEAGMILPDLTTLHGMLSQDQALVATGDQTVEINRIQGTIARLWQRMNNSGTSIAPQVPSQYQLRYASNQNPRTLHPYQLTAFADDWYRAALPYSAAPIFDAIAENLARDAVDVEGLSNPQVITTIPTGTVINAGARLFTVYEVLAPLA